MTSGATTCPPHPDPWLTLVQDALAVDDGAGRDRGYVVYADGVALEGLVDVLVAAFAGVSGGAPDAEAAGPPEVGRLLRRLPPVLREPVLRRLQAPGPSPLLRGTVPLRTRYREP